MKRNFIQNSKAWYGESCLKGKKLVDEFVFFVEDENGTRIGTEFIVAFMDLGNRGKIAAQIQCFDDGCRTLEACTEVIGMLAVLDEIGFDSQPHQFAGQLLAHEYNDVTPRYANQGLKDRREILRKQIEELHAKTDWDSVPDRMMSVGLFVKDKEFFVAAVNVGSPDSDIDIIGATIFGTSSIAYGDEDQDHGETIDMLLVREEEFMRACSPMPAESAV